MRDPRNGDGLTRRGGFMRRQRESATEIVKAALVSPSTRLHRVTFKGDRVHIEILTEDLVVASARRAKVRPRRVVVQRDPHGLEGRRLPAREGSPRFW